jgi:hypothetical protein
LVGNAPGSEGTHQGFHLLLNGFYLGPYFGLAIMYHSFEPSHGGYQMYEIHHNYLPPGLNPNGAQFTTQSN